MIDFREGDLVKILDTGERGKVIGSAGKDYIVKILSDSGKNKFVQAKYFEIEKEK